MIGPKPKLAQPSTTHLRLELDAARMSDHERKVAAETLRRALGLLEKPAITGTAD